MNDKINTNKEERIISLALWKAVGIMVVAMLGSAGAGLWGAVATVNSDHYSVLAIQREISDLDSRYMPLNLSLEKWKNNDDKHNEIIKKLDSLTTAVNNLYQRIK
jgi:hypothetical protein